MQFLVALPIDVRKFVEARTPSSPLDAAQVSDSYVETQQQQGRKDTEYHKFKFSSNKKPAVFSQKQEAKFVSAECSTSVNDSTPDAVSNGIKPNIKCWNCNGDHKRVNCPQKQQATASQDHKAAEVSGKGKYNKFKIDRKDQTGFNVALVNRKVFVFVNGKRVNCLRDSGSDVSLVPMHLVSKSSYTGDCIEICGVTGKKQTLPVAILNIR